MDKAAVKNTDIVKAFLKKISLSFFLFIGVLAGGTAGYNIIDGGKHPLIDYLYMTVISVTTVGFGEIFDLSQNPAGRIFTMGLIFTGMGVIVHFVTSLTAFLVEGDLKEIFRRNKMIETIKKMSDHYIVCGAGTIGAHIVQELHRTKRRLVVIDIDEPRLEALREQHPGIGTVSGDATENDTLLEAGLERAKGVVSAMDNDKDNLVVTISVKQIAPMARVIARCKDIRHSEKFKRAGADSVVSANFIGGLRMASEMIRPKVVGFLDIMLRDTERALRIEEVHVAGGGPADGKKISDLRGYALLMAVVKPDGAYEFNPKDDFTVTGGMTVIFMGSPEDRERLAELNK